MSKVKRGNDSGKSRRDRAPERGSLDDLYCKYCLTGAPYYMYCNIWEKLCFDTLANVARLIFGQRTEWLCILTLTLVLDLFLTVTPQLKKFACYGPIRTAGERPTSQTKDYSQINNSDGRC